MNRARTVLNGFSSEELSRVTGLSRHMVNYLVREGYITPTYRRDRTRGKVRYYSYRDLLIARIIQRLAGAGVELRRLKQAIRLLKNDESWHPKNGKEFDLLTTDGRSIFFHQKNGSLLELPTGQHSFAFVLDVRMTAEELKQRMDERKRKRFSLENSPLDFAERNIRSRKSKG